MIRGSTPAREFPSLQFEVIVLNLTEMVSVAIAIAAFPLPACPRQ